MSKTGNTEQAKSDSPSSPAGAIGKRTSLIVLIALVAVLAVAGALIYMQYSSLQSSYSTLQSQKDALQADYNALNANYTALQSNYNALLNNIEAIQAENALLDDIVNMRKTETFLEDSFVEIEEGGSLKLQYLISYAGYLDVSVVSGNSMYVVITNSDYNTVSRLPLEGAINMLELRAAILPGNTEVEIFNNDPGTAFVTINIDYAY